MGFTTTTTTTTTTNSSNNNTSNVISSNGRSIVLAEVVVAKAAAHKHNRHRHKKAFRAIIIFISITITITIRQSPSSPHRGNLRHVSVAILFSLVSSMLNLAHLGTESLGIPIVGALGPLLQLI